MSQPMDAARQRNRAVWEAGDWNAIAPNIAGVGPRLLDRIGDVGPGVRLLDVGTGNGGTVAIPAAQRGAEVTGVDVTDAWFAAGRRGAEDAGIAVDWVVGDAVELPFADGAFDVVTSTFGHMFAPDQHAAAAELVRVCRPGGTIGLCCWTPEGNNGRLFVSLASLMPPPPEGFRPPVMWGSEQPVRELLEPLGVELQMRRTAVTMKAESPEAQAKLYESSLGPVVAARAALGEERWATAREGMLELLTEVNERDDGTMCADYEYLETIGRRA